MLFRSLSDIRGITLQKDQKNTEAVFWMNGICLNADYGKSRDELITYLSENAIDTRLFFNGMHKQPALIKHGASQLGDFPVSDMLAEHGFYLPSGSGLEEADIAHICGLIRNFGD